MVPYNIASYALLTEILAKICNMIPGDLVHTFGDVHIYDNHQEQVDLQLTRKVKELPILSFGMGFDNEVESFNDGFSTLDDLFNNLKPDLFHLKNYNPHPFIKAKLSTGLK